jgi:hypothetical protein
MGTNPATDHRALPNKDSEKAQRVPSKVLSRHKRTDEEDVPMVRTGHANTNQPARNAIPPARISSPPAWLKNPCKEPAENWIHQKLRHVSTQDSHYTWRSHHSAARNTPALSKSPLKGDRMYAHSQVSLPIVKRVTHLNKLKTSSKPRQNEWTARKTEHSAMNHRSQSPQSQQTYDPYHSGELQRTVKPPSILTTSQLSVSQSKQEKNRGMHVFGKNQICPRPEIAGVNEQWEHGEPTTLTHLGIGADNSEEHSQDSYRLVAGKRDTQMDRLDAEKTRSSKDFLTEQSLPSRITSSIFSTPSQALQPLKLPMSYHKHNETETKSESQASTNSKQLREAFTVIDKPSDLSVHHPSAIAPPNHECSWKDSYMALTSEIRQLKADISTKNHVQPLECESMHEEDTLGLEGLTIVIHLRDKDDLVINTELVQDDDK